MLAAWLWDATPSTPQAVAPATGTPTPNQTATFEANATQFAAWMATYVATTGVTPTPSPNPTATGTPDVTATALAACVFNMETTDDPQVWPSVLVPGQQFIKRWTILNTGTCPWPEGVHLAHLSGEVDVLDKPEISPVAPGESIEVKITLRAPTAYDRYTSMWQLRDSAGRPIGETLEFQCRVGPTPTPRPTATPTATATPEFTPTPSEFLHFSVPLVTDWHDTQDGKWWAEVGLTAWGGDGTYRYYLNYVSPETEFFYGVYEITANVCTSWWGTVIVTSGDEEQRWGGKIAYPDPKKCE